MLINYKEKKVLSDNDSKDVQYAVESQKLQYQSNLLATRSALAEQNKILEDLKCQYPLDFEALSCAYSKVQSLTKGIQFLDKLGKDLGFK